MSRMGAGVSQKQNAIFLRPDQLAGTEGKIVDGSENDVTYEGGGSVIYKGTREVSTNLVSSVARILHRYLRGLLIPWVLVDVLNFI